MAILIGMNVRGAHDIFDIRRSNDTGSAPDGILTPFGWIAVGTTGPSPPEERRIFHIGNVETCDHYLKLHESVDRFWGTESLGTVPMSGPLLSNSDRQAIAMLNASVKHLGDRYEVGMIWKNPELQLPDNRQLALRRLLTLEKRFENDPE